MRLHRDDLGIETPVVWYYVDDDAPAIPYAHAFGSRDWEFADGRGEAILGEVSGTRRYYGGQKPVELDGQNFCGSREQWERGASLLDASVPLNPTTQNPCCCGSGASLFPTAPVLGLGVELIMPPTILTYCKAQPTAEVWAVSLAGFVDQPPGYSSCSNLNGTWKMPFLSACQWRGNDIIDIGALNVRHWLIRGSPLYPGKWAYRIATGSATGTQWSYTIAESDWNLTEPNELTLFENIEPTCNPPATVVLTPAFP